jgi:hypothetical protein
MATDELQRFQPAPWTLRGDAAVSVKLVRKERVQPLIPPDAHIICVWPGRTLAVLYLAQYHASPVGEYRELIVAPALVRIRGCVGFWISHILVDSDASMMAGRSIWALPKELASMQWQSKTQTQMRVDAALLKLSARFSTPRASVRVPFVGAALSRLGGITKQFTVRGIARVGTTRATIDLAAVADLQALAFQGARTLFVAMDMNITIGSPRTS